MNRRAATIPLSASTTQLVCEDSDSDPDFKAELQSERSPRQNRKRKRTEVPRTTLRDLLGLGIADDFIQTVSYFREHSSAGVSLQAPHPPVGEVEKDPNITDTTSSSEEELVLPTTARSAPVKTARIVDDGASHQKHGTSSTDTSVDEDETLSEEYSLSTSRSRGINLLFDPVPSLPSQAEIGHILEESQQSTVDDDEVLLSTKPASSSRVSDTAPLSNSKLRAAVVVDGQRPSFPVPAEMIDTSPLLLGPNTSVPASINRFLRTYQQDGVKFLWRSYSENRGALLGDDMGLGKTVQVIAFLAAIMQKTGLESDADRRIEAVRNDRQLANYHKANRVWPTCLIICPSSVIDNWRHELDTWGFFEHAAFTGSRAKESLDNFRRGRLDIIVTSHETASLAIDQLSTLDWSCIIIDEAHKLKNPVSQMTLSMHKFRCMTRFALTGTSIQNTYRELYTLADWTNPGLLGSVKEWVLEIEKPLKQGQRRDATEEELANSRTRAEKLVRNVLPLFFLRRTKTLIQDQLPRKFDKVVFCPMTPTQLGVYKRILDEPEVDFMKRHADPCQCGRLDPDTGLSYRRQNCCFKRDSTGEKWNKNMLKYIYLLQKCSNHVALVFPEPEDAAAKEPDRVERYQRQLGYVQLMFPNDWVDKRCNAANGMDEKLCGKWKILSELLTSWHSQGDKVLLFSTNIRLLQFIEIFVTNQGHSFLRLDGSTPQHRRQQLVNEFNRESSIFLFLISTTAGGTGLNLTAANRVVVFDPHWNPSHDMQAMDRAYRFGQTRDVYVYRLIGAGSLEECVYGRQLYKQQQMEIGYTAAKERRYFQGVAGDQQNLGELFGCKNLFTLHETNLTMKSIIDECNVTDVTFALERYLGANPSGDSDDAIAALADLVNHESATLPIAKELDSTVDPAKAILDRAGIHYVHEHTSLTGGSSAEALRTSSAQTTANRARKRVLKRATASASASAPVWPPPRPKAGSITISTPALLAVQSSQEQLHKANKARTGTNIRIPSLKELAALHDQSEAEFAAAIQELSADAQASFFASAIDRWTSAQDRAAPFNVF